MLLEDFVKAQQAGSVGPGGAGSVDDLTQKVNSPDFNSGAVFAAEPPSTSVVDSVKNFGSDLANLGRTYGARIGANYEQSLGGILQWLNESDEPIKTLYGADHDAKMQAVVDSLAQRGRDIGAEGRAIAKDVQQTNPMLTYPGKISTGVVESLGQMVPATAAGFVGGVPAALGVMSTEQFGQTYDEARAQGQSQTDAGENAFIQGATEGATDLLPFVALTKFFKPGKLSTKIAHYYLAEVPGEHVATAVQNTTGKYFDEKDPEKRKQAAIDYFFSKEHGQDQLDTFWTTIAQGAVLGGGATVTHKIGGAKETTQAQPQYAGLPNGTLTQPDQVSPVVAPSVSVQSVVDESDVLSRLRQQVTQLTEPVTPEELGVEGVQSEQPSTAAAGTVQPENVGTPEPSPVSSPDVTPTDVQVQQVSEVGQPPTVDLSVLRNPALAQEVVQHFTNPVKEDNLVVASPSLTPEANFAEDLLISTGVRAHVGIFSRDDILANPEISGFMGGKIGEFADRHQLKGNAGSIARIPTPNGTKYVISIDPSLKNDVERLTTITHEAVGHVVAFERYDAATPEQKADIEKDFAAFVDRVHGAKTKEERAAVSREFFPFSIKSPSSVSTEYATALMDQTNVGKEWLANRITEWALSDKKPQTRAEKWFKGLANRLKKIFAKAQDQRTANQLPVQSVNEWLNSIYNPSLLDSVEKSKQNEERVVERHTGKVAKSLAEERRILERTVPAAELARFVVGKSANGNPNSVDVSVKMDGGTQVVLKTITSTSRSSAIREAQLFKLRAAAGAQNIVKVSRPVGKRMEYYRKTLAEFKQVIQEYADDHGLSFNQTWLNFIGDPASFRTSTEATEIFRRLDEQGQRIFRRIMSVVEHNPEGARKALVVEKQVVPKETQETEQTEKEINQELEQPVEVPVENSKQNVGTENTFEGRVLASAQDAVTAMLTAGTKVNLERVQSNVGQRLRLTGQDAKLARKVVEREWERLKSGTAAPTVDVPAGAVTVPDDVSDEEAQAFLASIDDFARKDKTKEEIKEQKIKDTLYKEAKPPRKKKVLTPEEQEKKEAAKLERRSKKEQEQREMLKTLIKAAETAKSKGLALTEYLSQNGFSDEENVKMMRLYLQHQGSIFSQREQIYRLAIDLGLYNSVTGDQGLQDFIKGVFPKSYGTLDTLGIRGRDIIVTRLQQMHEQMLGHELDFTTVITMKDVKAAKEKEFESLSFRRKAHLFINTLMDRMQDGLNTTPHGAQLVWNLKQVIGAQYSLYARDYMTHIDKFKQDFPNVEDREKIGEKYQNREQGDTEAERRAIALMHQISKSYGMEMERLGFKIYYDSKHQELFKFNPEENYFPRIWEDGTFEDKNKVRQMANELVRSGRAINEKEARKLINNFRRRYHRLRVPSYANMEMARETDMGGWIKDPAEVFARYVASGSRRLAVMRVLGPTAEAKLLSMARDHYVATDDPDSFEDAVSVVNAVLGSAVNPNKSAKTSWGVDELQFAAIATMLQHSSLLQPGVAANVIGRIGWKKTLVGFSKILAPNKHTREQNLARGYALGVAERFIAKEIFDNLDADGSARDRADKLLHTWKVTSIDRWMRAGTALAGEMHVMETFSNFVNGDPKARRELAKLYVDADQMKQAFDNGDEEHVKDWVKMGAFQLTQQTNFATDALTIPQWLKGQSPWLNLLTLFSRFSFHQAKYWSDLVRNDKSKVANQLLAQVAFGAPIYLLRLLAKGIDPWKELEKDSLLKTLWGMLLSGSGLGLFAEAVINALSGTTSQSAGGPIASSLSNWAGVSGKAARGVFSNEGLDEHGYHSALQKLIDAGIYGAARFLPAPVGVPVAAGLGFAAPAIKRNFLPVSNQQEETNWTGR